jgi:PIN domain nuclease of toxin-antitoxin system
VSECVLLDTHAVIWSLSEPQRLGPRLRKLFRDRTFLPLVSTVSLWEILAKAKAGKLHFSGDPESSLRQHLADLRSSILPLRLDHVYAAYRLPVLHKDPWDRLLMGQAVAEGALLATRDEAILQYDVPVIW